MSNYIQIWREFQPHEYIGMTDAEGDMACEIEKLREEITRLRAGLQRIVDADGWWDAPSLARDLLEGKDVA